MSSELPPDLPSPHANPASGSRRAKVLEAVQHVLGSLSARCRLLLKAASLEYKPAEIATLLGVPDQNKKVSDDLRHCRNRLVEQLRRRGLPPFAEDGGL